MEKSKDETESNTDSNTDRNSEGISDREFVQEFRRRLLYKTAPIELVDKIKNIIRKGDWVVKY